MSSLSSFHRRSLAIVGAVLVLLAVVVLSDWASDRALAQGFATPETVARYQSGASTASDLKVNGKVNPSTFGLPSMGDARSTTGTITAGSTTLTVASSTSFLVNQGIFLGHAGPVCGITRGTACPGGPTATVTGVGATGSRRYTYQTACIDGLGGVGIAGSAVTFSGYARLSSTNYNLLTFSGLPGCIETAIYRNHELIATSYAATSGTWTFSDTGQSAVSSHRDIPLTPPTAPLSDNLVAEITNVTGNSLTLSTTAGGSVAGGLVLHSDTPLLQAAVNSGGGLIQGDITYLLNYPLNLTGRGGLFTFSATCDTGDVCVDETGAYFMTLQNVNLLERGTLTQPSTVGLYCARDVTLNSGTAQYVNTTNLFVQLTGTVSGTGHGNVALYNYGCEIEKHDNANLNADQLVVLTANNIWNVPSLFDVHQATGAQSMSQIDFIEPTGGTATGSFWTLDNAYSVQIFGGYHNGGHSTTYPWGFELYGQSGDIRVIGYRTENRSGFAHLHASAALVYSTIDYGLYRQGSPPEPSIQMDNSTTVNEVYFRADDYGGTPVTQAIYSCATSNCSFVNSQVQLGYWQTFDATHAIGDAVQSANSGAEAYSGAYTWKVGLRVSGTDLNTLTSCGYYDGQDLAHGPAAFGSKFMRVQVVCSADTGYLTQMAYDMTGATNNSYVRNETGGTWGAWEPLHSDTAAPVSAMQLTSRSKISCSVSTAGTFNYIAGASGTKDTVQVCAKDSMNTYAWRTVY